MSYSLNLVIHHDLEDLSRPQYLGTVTDMILDARANKWTPYFHKLIVWNLLQFLKVIVKDKDLNYGFIVIERSQREPKRACIDKTVKSWLRTACYTTG